MYDLVVIGAGAAGLMAAGMAASSGRKVLVLEKMEKPARKVRITGKGRCNITNICEHEVFLSKVRSNADFFRYSFEQFDNQAVIDFFRNEGLRITIERGGRVFPESGKARDVAEALADYAVASGAEIMCYAGAVGVRKLGEKINGVRIVTRRGFERVVDCSNVLIATGGASYPATGSTGDGYKLAHELGHNIIEVRPALTSLLSRSSWVEQLKGLALKYVLVSLEVDSQVVATEFGEMEFGTRGIEGAVIVRLSRMAVDALIDGSSVAIILDLKSALTTEVLKARIERELEEIEGEGKVGDLLRKLMPKALVDPFAKVAGVARNMFLSRLDEDAIARIIDNLKAFRIPVDDYGPFEFAFVTAGGVDVSEVDESTMQSRLVKGLYFAGEVLDLDADTGGYNLQIAFSTGRLAGRLKG